MCRMVLWLLLWFSAVVISSPLCAQFDHLVTTDDGEVLYFSSSLRMRGMEQISHRKLFVADAQGVRLHTQRERQVGMATQFGVPVSNYYSIEGAALSGDGSVMGVIARRDCFIGSGCLQVPRYQTEIGGGAFRGIMSLSRNGRYAVVLGDGTPVGYFALSDLSTGQKLEGPGGTSVPSSYGRRRVTSDGTALAAASSGLWLIRLDGSTTVPLPDRPLDAVIDDEGRSVVYEAAQAGEGGRKLVHVDLANGAVRVLALSAAPMQPCLSNDGEVVLFLLSPEAAGAPQVFVLGADGTGRRQLTDFPAGVAEVVLAGNGKVAYAVSGTGRLVRIDVDSGATQQVIGRSVSLAAPSTYTPPYPVPGSAFSVTGSGFADSAQSVAPPLPLSLNGLELLLDGRPLPLQTVAPSRILFQLPWDVTAGMHRLEARTGSDAFFETQPIDLEVRHQAFAQFEQLGPSASGLPYVLAAHQDWSGLVTPETPARPGEIIHQYMTGLGPVEPAVETGAPSPWDPPARVRLSFSCHFQPSVVSAPARPAEILFAGLAPLFTGYYQVSMRIPEDVPLWTDKANLYCSFPNPGSGTSTWIPVSAP